jgi:hypothetical protein
MKFEDLKIFFERVKTEWQEDSKIDFQFTNKQYSVDLAKIALDIPYQHNKYLNYHTDFYSEKSALEFQRRIKIKEKREYYQGESNAEVYKENPFGQSIKTSEKLKVYLDADPDLINIEIKIKYVEQALFYLDNILKMVSNRSYQIGHAIEWEKFINGNN